MKLLFTCLFMLTPFASWAQVQCEEEISRIFTAVFYRHEISSYSSPAAPALYQELYSLYYIKLAQKYPHLRPEQLQEYFVGLELGSDADEIASWLKRSFEPLLEAYLAGTPCVTPNRDVNSGGKLNSELISLGAKRAFTTAYQSCESWLLPSLKAEDADVEGIEITGKHSDGIGNKREIKNLQQVQTTHPYLLEVYPDRCLPIRNNPLIYDYGGKPAADEQKNYLNFFANSGSGTKALGTDCSGFVFSSLAAAGVRVKKSQDLKPYQVNGISARMYINPEANGLSCFSKLKLGFRSLLKPGDIIASSGHIVIVESVGADPLGFLSINQIGHCESLDAEMFDFTVVQSSNNKMGVGINKYEAKDFVPTNEIFSVSLVEYARAACRAYLKGTQAEQNISNLAIVRLNSDPSCRSASKIKLVGQSCVSACWN